MRGRAPWGSVAGVGAYHRLSDSSIGFSINRRNGRLARRQSVLPPPLRPSEVAWTSGRVRTIGSSCAYTAATERGGPLVVRTFPISLSGFRTLGGSFARRAAGVCANHR